MDRIRQLIHEAHRRSLWQVLSVYLVASWVALQVVEIITESAGLPDWAQPFALMLLIIGLPIVLATAVVQEGRPGRGGEPRLVSPSPRRPKASWELDQGDGGDGSVVSDPTALDGTPGEAASAESKVAPPEPEVSAKPEAPSTQSGAAAGVKRLFTWRNAIVGGVSAFALLGILVVGYFIMWSAGIGPVGSLAAQGVFEEGDAVVLAQFENTSDDESLGDMVTEALRVDLAGSSMMTLVEPGRIQDALARMGRSGDEVLHRDLAREVAVRDGFKAVIHGTVGSAGNGYLFVASMQAAESGQVLATFRESARGPDEVIDAIDKLSQDIREKAGESLRSIKAEEPLENVTTSSLEALKKYAEADRLADQAEYPRALAALEEAIGLDPEFAMAYRRLAVLIQNSGGTLSSQVDAAVRAYELRDRLTERERFLAVAYYHNLVTLDLDAEIQAYETILARYPDDQTALNNIALALVDKSRVGEAVAALERAVNGPGASASAFTNLPAYLALAGRHDEAEEALAQLEARYPGRSLWISWLRYPLAAFREDPQGTRAAGAGLLALPEAQGGWRAAGYLASLVGSGMGGNLRDARGHAEDGVREMTALDDWSQVLFLQLNLVRLEMLWNGRDGAEAVYSRFNLMESLDSISPAVRDYPGVLWVLAGLGKEAEVRDVLELWRADGTPSSSGRVFDEARRAAEALSAGQADPVAGLTGLNNLSRDLNCSGCFLWARARFAEEAGQWEEARDLFLRFYEGGADDIFAEPLQRVMAHERLGRVFEALGDAQQAADHYAIVVDIWADADPELYPRREAARERVAALVAPGNS